MPFCEKRKSSPICVDLQTLVVEERSIFKTKFIILLIWTVRIQVAGDFFELKQKLKQEVHQ